MITTFFIWLFFLLVFCSSSVVVLEMLELGITTYLSNKKELENE